MPDIYKMWMGSDESWHIIMNGEDVHVCKDRYESDMFVAELKARLNMTQQEETRDEGIHSSD